MAALGVAAMHRALESRYQPVARFASRSKTSSGCSSFARFASRRSSSASMRQITSEMQDLKRLMSECGCNFTPDGVFLSASGKEEAAKVKADGKSWYKTMISDTDYTEFDVFSKWLRVS